MFMWCLMRTHFPNKNIKNNQNISYLVYLVSNIKGSKNRRKSVERKFTSRRIAWSTCEFRTQEFRERTTRGQVAGCVIEPFAFDVFDPRAVVTLIASSCKNDIHTPWDSPWCAFLWWRTLAGTVELYADLFLFHFRETSFGVIERFLSAKLYIYIFFFRCINYFRFCTSWIFNL